MISKIKFVDTDYRKLELRFDGYIRPIALQLTQLDVLRIMKALKYTNNDEYYNLFCKLIMKIDEIMEVDTNMDRLKNGLPRRRILDVEMERYNKQCHSELIY